MKTIIASLGVISLIVGVIGIFVPLLPTVPFVLLSAYLFAKSSTKMHNWIMNHKTFGKYIQNYQEDKSIPLQVKVMSIIMLWSSMSISIFFLLENRLELQLLLLTITIAISTFLIRMKTRKVEKRN